GPGHEHLLDRPARAHAARGRLAAPARGLERRGLRDGLHLARGPLARDELVDHAARRGARARDERGAHAVGVDGRGSERRDRELVEVGGHDDLGVPRPERVELAPGLDRERGEVARVDAHRTEPRARDLDRAAHALGDVVGVDEQRRARTERRDLRGEGGALVVVQEREGVRRGPDRLDPVAPARLELGRRGEPRDDRGARSGDRGLLVRAARPHLEARAADRRARHARGRGRHGGVVVEHRERERLEHDGLGEGPLDHEHGGVREVGLALGVAADGPPEAVVREPVERRSVHDPLAREPRELGIAETEVLELLEQAARAREHPVAAPRREAPGEHLEHRASVRGAVREGGLEHRELVAVGQQGARTRRGRHGPNLGPGVLTSPDAGLPRARAPPRVGLMPLVVVRASVPLEEVDVAEDLAAADAWVTIVWNDPVNLMSYVTYVFRSYFGYPQEEAERLMLLVHHEGKAVVSTGNLEEMERDVQAMHSYGPWATLQRSGE